MIARSVHKSVCWTRTGVERRKADHLRALRGFDRAIFDVGNRHGTSREHLVREHGAALDRFDDDEELDELAAGLFSLELAQIEQEQQGSRSGEGERDHERAAVHGSLRALVVAPPATLPRVPISMSDTCVPLPVTGSSMATTRTSAPPRSNARA